ncbi:MAG: MmcQ/YjbR family DNA-binding protein [Gemmatimonadales bacterium]
MGAKGRRRPSPLSRLRRLALGLSEAHEVEAWGAPTFRVRNRLFAMYASANDHHGGGRPGVWIKALAENQTVMIAMRPDRFFKPPYVGPSGWIGVWLDDAPDWNEVRDLLFDGWCLTAPKTLVKKVTA